MNEKLSPKAQLENFAKKLDSPRITLLQIRNLVGEFQELTAGIFNKDKREPTKEENEIINKFYRESNKKFFSFVDE
jgi:hypothetical protein